MSDDIDRDAIEILGINPKIWKEYRRMTGEKYVQDDLDGFAKAEAEALEKDISVITKQKHLAQWGLRFEKYASFSKDPEFKKRCMQMRAMCFKMMDKRER